MVIGIYDACGFNVKFDEHSTFLGGSETWLLEISKAISDMGHMVFLFCNAKFHTYKNIVFVPKSKLRDVSSKVNYDIFVYSRGIEHFDWIKAKRVGVFLHDMTLTDYGENHALDKMSSIFVLSEWSKQFFQETYGHAYDDKIKISFNGVHQELYTERPQKTKSMVWSSCFERGLKFFITFVVPKIKSAVPDFELKICSYNNYAAKYDGVTFLGRLSKEQLANEQLKASIWCYPNLGVCEWGSPFKETFCISAVENALAGNCILTTALGGLGTTAHGIEFLTSEFYRNDRIDNYEDYGKYLAQKCVDALTGKFFTTFDATKYTWKNAATSILKC